MTVTIDSPIALPCGVRIRNRLCKAALTEGLADSMNRATKQLAHLYGRWSLGGAGLVITGNVQIDRTHLERPGNVAIDDNGGLDELKAYAAAGTQGGNHLWMQINHPGRQCPQAINAHPLAPSAVTLDVLGGGFGQPCAATESDIADLIRRFAHVATVARSSGFTGVQIHAAHGYLISQFLSPIANRREDHWGGNLENRARFLLGVVRAVRAAVGADFPISVKLNSADFQTGGFTNEDAQQVVKWLGAEHIDLLELSGGTYEQLVMIGAGSEAANPVKASTRRREAYFLQYASLIKPVATMPVMVTGGFRTLAGMQEALGDSSVDMIGLGRPMCVDPDLPGKLLRNQTDRAPMWEQQLALPADVLGPDVAPAMHKQVETWGKQGWFCLQLIRLGNGLSPDLSMSVLDAFNNYAKNESDAAACLQRE